MDDDKRKRRLLSLDEAQRFIWLASEYHAGRIKLSPEIEEKRREIVAAIENADRFIAIFRVVDYGMVDSIVELKLQLDGLYCDWAIKENSKYVVH